MCEATCDMCEGYREGWSHLPHSCPVVILFPDIPTGDVLSVKVGDQIRPTEMEYFICFSMGIVIPTIPTALCDILSHSPLRTRPLTSVTGTA